MNKTGLGIEDILGEKRTAILNLVAQYGGTNVRVFGSVARGEARPDSDIDLLVSFPHPKNIFDVVGLWQDLTELLGRDVTLLTDGALKPRMKERILADAIPL